MPCEQASITKRLRQIFSNNRCPSEHAVKQNSQMDKFIEALAQNNLDYNELSRLSWNGVPHCIRAKVWRLLLRYSLNKDTEIILSKKRQQYAKLVMDYWKPEEFNEDEKKVFRTIDTDVRRIGVQYNAVCRSSQVQEILKKVLLTWHHRHPAIGYVQGMCDIAMPFLLVFLGQYLPYDYAQDKFTADPALLSEATLLAIEADIYWCAAKTISLVSNNYTQDFKGLREAHAQVERHLQKIDLELYRHLEQEKVDLFAWCFRSISTLLLRCFRPNIGIRLFDTLLAYESEYPELILFMVLALLERFAEQMLKMRFDQLMGYLQNLPTKYWNEDDLELLVAEAYAFQNMYSKKESN